MALKLFEKIGRRMELTQAGKDIMPFVDRNMLDFITSHQRKPFSLICNEPDGY